MTRICLAYAAAATCSLAAALASAAGLSPAMADPRVVIELFTSQGCSSCPAADRLLGDLAEDPAYLPVSLPIDYWDYLGWKDTLADPRNTARQKAYAKVRGDREVYTPQAIINGSSHVVGNDRAAVESGIAPHQGSGLVLPVTMTVSDGRLHVSVPERDDLNASAEVFVWGLARAVTVAIKRGENRGKTITYHNVVRRWVNVGKWQGKASQWALSLRDLDGEGIDEAALLVQSGTVEKPNVILGASLVSLH